MMIICLTLFSRVSLPISPRVNHQELIMKFFVFAVLAICALFFLLGLKSQKGKAKGLVGGHLAEPGSAPNIVSSEIDVQPEKKIAPRPKLL